jgi:microcystin degradation protein MlrC
MSTRLRLAIGGLAHETNQYVSSSTELEAFEVTTGDGIFSRRAGRTYVGGMLAAAAEIGAVVVGTLHAYASPSGTISAPAYRQLKDGLLERIGDALPVDAVALDLHGAGVAEEVTDLEGDLCQAVRRLVGPDVKIVVTHDLHGHATQDEADAVDLLLGVHRYPHDDMFERGHEAVMALPALVSDRSRPYTHVERLPLLVPTTTTYHGAGAAALAICQELEQLPGVIDCTFMHGFPYTDNEIVGAQVVVATEADPVLARAVARDAATRIWGLREGFTSTHPQPREALARALASPHRLVVVNETSDNPGGGAPCDGTHLLRELVAANPEGAVFIGLRDPEVVRQAQRAGAGSDLDIRLGGKTDDLHGSPLACRARVELLTDGDLHLEAAMGAGTLTRLGPTALLSIGRVRVIVISNPEQTYDRTPLLLHGIDPADCRLVCLKSSHHFRSGWQLLAEEIITTDPPGLTTTQLDQLPRQRSPRPLFPLDPEAVYLR